MITYVPYEGKKGDNQSPHDHLNQLLNLISRLRGGASRYVPLLMSKVQETLPNMSNPLTHMPHTLDAFIESPAGAGSSPQGVGKEQPGMKVPPPPSTQVHSPTRSSTFPGPAREQSYNDGMRTPQQKRLIFETYSPSIASHSHSEPGNTPSIYDPSHQQYTQHASSHLSQPRNTPISAPASKQEVWNDYHG